MDFWTVEGFIYLMAMHICCNSATQHSPDTWLLLLAIPASHASTCLCLIGVLQHAANDITLIWHLKWLSVISAWNQSGIRTVFYHQRNVMLSACWGFLLFEWKKRHLWVLLLCTLDTFNSDATMKHGLLLTLWLSSLRTHSSEGMKMISFHSSPCKECCGLFCYDWADNQFQMGSVWFPLYKKWPLLSGPVKTLGHGWKSKLMYLLCLTYE